MNDAQKANHHAWHETGVWLAGDPHCHYRLVGVEELAIHAKEHCDFIGVTEHGHMTDAFAAQASLVEDARKRHPDLVIINGVQWEAPLGDSVTVLAPGASQAMPMLQEFLNQFDVRIAGIGETQENFLEGLRFLAGHAVSGALPAALIQYPHSNKTFPIGQVRAAMDTGAMAGLAISSANRQESPGGGILHPWVALVGGLADELLAEGRRFAMTADGDFHHFAPGHWGQTEFWPGEYRRTYLYCPDKTEAGVFAGLRSGAWYVVVGNLVEGLRFTASSRNDIAMLGEELLAPVGCQVTVTTQFAATGNVESLQLIGNPGGPVRVLAETDGGSLTEEDGRLTWVVELDAAPGTFFIRAKAAGTAPNPGGKTAALATGAVWVKVQ